MNEWSLLKTKQQNLMRDTAAVTFRGNQKLAAPEQNCGVGMD